MPIKQIHPLLASKEPLLKFAEDHALFAVSSLDGRYHSRMARLAPIVSEAGLIAYRVRVEAEWLLFLAEQPQVAPDLKLSEAAETALRRCIHSLDTDHVQKVKELEKTTNHDVKAVEYLLRKVLLDAGASEQALAFIHFACTSEDINNLAYALMLDDARQKVILPEMEQLILALEGLAAQTKGLSMLARTHGQTASPTTLGKEMAVFAHRLRKQKDKLSALRLEGKMSGAVGNYNAHHAAYPEIDWISLTKTFLRERLKLDQNLLTTQIENHDAMVEYCEVIKRFNSIFIGFCRDMWSYISIGYFKQKMAEHEVGSSTMPHKVNPIDFENAEGNLGVANSLAAHFSDKLLISRWQRDLSDSTVQRVLGTFLGHTTLAYQSLLKGLGKVHPSPEVIGRDLDQAWEVLGEAFQTVMRRYGVADAYERLKAATRGASVTQSDLHRVLDDCPEIPAAAKQRLLKLLPQNYTGLAGPLLEIYLKDKPACS